MQLLIIMHLFQTKSINIFCEKPIMPTFLKVHMEQISNCDLSMKF